MTEFQKKCVERLTQKGGQSVNELSWGLNTSRVAVVSAMRSLEKQGLAASYRRGRDQWAPLCFYLLDRATPS